MYEYITYEMMIKGLLNRIKKYDPDTDTREHSIAYYASASAALEFLNVYAQLDAVLYDTFADTARRPYLIKRAWERGLTPYLATYAILQGEFNIDVPIGARFSLANSDLNYVVYDEISPGVYEMMCETPGSVGNEGLGQLIPIDYIDGLTQAKLTELLIPGEDEEDTEHFRRRYFDSLDSQAFGGNIKDYKDKVNAIPGVGGVKVYPVWNGGGTVKLVIISSEYTEPTPTLIDVVQTIIDPTQNNGEGLGLAPIGHVVTVEGVATTALDITVDITYESGWVWGDVEDYVNEAIDNYLAELAYEWVDNDAVVVRISQIETRLLGLPGVIDVGDATINGLPQNLTLGNDEIPVRGDVVG